MIVNKEDIEQFEQRYRTAFVNSLAGFRQAVLVGTRSADGFPNLAIFNSLIHLGANPALLGLISRPDRAQRDTLENIKETGAYTLNYIPTALYEKAHQTSARYDKTVSEFEEVGLKEWNHPDCSAPFVEEAVVKIVMKLESCIPIPLNGTLLIAGSIQQVHIEATMVEEDGFVALSDAGVLISQGLDAYFTTQKIGRLPYAKPHNRV